MSGATTPRQPTRGRRVVVLVAALLAFAGTAKLGAWQLARASEKEALQSTLDSRSRLPKLSASEVATTEAEAAGQHYRHVRLRGRWAAQSTFFLDNRQMDARPGFFVLTPLKLVDRAESVLVQRGWTPRNANDRALVPEVPTPGDEVELLGVIAPPPGRLYDFGGAGSGTIRQNLSLDAYARESGLKLLPFTVLQSDSPSTAGDGLLRHWPMPAVDIDRHYGYAFQWFALSALIAGLYAWFQLLKPRFGRTHPHPVSQ